MKNTFLKRTEFTLERRFDAAPERMFRAFTDPDDLKRWIWASLSSEVWSEIDLRVGGAYRIYTKLEGGRHQGRGWSGMCGLYVIVEPGRRLVFTLQWDANVGYNLGGAQCLDEVVDVKFTPDGDGTLLSLTHRGIPDDGQSVQTHKQGVAESLEMLNKVVA